MLDLKVKQKLIAGISKEEWHNFEPHPISRHAYCCNKLNTRVKATNISIYKTFTWCYCLV